MGKGEWKKSLKSVLMRHMPRFFHELSEEPSCILRRGIGRDEMLQTYIQDVAVYLFVRE